MCDGTYAVLYVDLMMQVQYAYLLYRLHKCKILQEYATMVAKIREFRQKGCDLDMAIEETIEYCLLHEVLKEFLLEHKSEVADMLRMEYDEARTMNHLKEDYYEEGVKDGEMKTKISLICRKLIKEMCSDIAELLEEDTSYVKKKYVMQLGDNPEKCDVDEVLEKLIKDRSISLFPQRL